MKVAITGGTGFVGSHLLRRFGDGEGDHEFVLSARGVDERNAELRSRDDVRFVEGSVADEETLRKAFSDCEIVVHLAGINHERGEQTYENVHVAGTRNVVEAATDAGVSKIVLTSYLRARPNCGCGYHESKWESERIVRRSGLEYTILKPGVIYGPGDQMLRSIARALETAPVFPRIGFETRHVRPVAIEDVVDVLVASVFGDRLPETTVAIVGPEELTVAELVERVGKAIGRRPFFAPTPVRVLSGMAWLQTRMLDAPIITPAGVRMLAEEATEPAPAGVCEPLPEDLQPTRSLSARRIEAGLPEVERLGLVDLRLWSTAR